MIRREMESPNPIPKDFVVKNGSNMRVWFSGFIPGPETIASIAFLTKFKMTCCSWMGSAVICGRLSCNSVETDIL